MKGRVIWGAYQRESVLPGFSAGKTLGWLLLLSNLVHFTLSAQLGPVWDSRAAASVDGGPLTKTFIQRLSMRTNKSVPAKL